MCSTTKDQFRTGQKDKNYTKGKNHYSPQALLYNTYQALQPNKLYLFTNIISLVLLQFFVLGCSKNSSANLNLSSKEESVAGLNVTEKEAKPIGLSATTMPDKFTASVNKKISEDENKLKAGDSSTQQATEIIENNFIKSNIEPTSTFSIDVDAASYSLCRRAINEGYAPPSKAVRIEELINYFPYDYPQPTDNKPFSITTELARCPWKSEHYVAMIGLQGKKIDISNAPPSNIVFLIDVSGSMQEDDKLPLLKESLKMLTNQLREQDKISVAVYAGAAGLVLPPTNGANKNKIISALDNLEAGGSTNGAEGIELAYKTAKDNFLKNGNNRVILATDGDFNVGPSSEEELINLIEKKREDGIFLTVLGFGSGNFQDSKMEQLADKGNGHYAYIDSKKEADKALVKELGSTLTTIAKDVKIQVAFNPALVKEYRLIGYENRVLNNEDFDDDKKDAGEIGAGHSVTAMYEIIPTNPINTKDRPRLDDFTNENISENNFNANEMFKVKFRYKNPTDLNSNLIIGPGFLTNQSINQPSINFQFATSVAEWGLLLRNSRYKGRASHEHVVQNATNAVTAGFRDNDSEGYRKEFIELVKKSGSL